MSLTSLHLLEQNQAGLLEEFSQCGSSVPLHLRYCELLAELWICCFGSMTSPTALNAEVTCSAFNADLGNSHRGCCWVNQVGRLVLVASMTMLFMLGMHQPIPYVVVHRVECDGRVER